MNKVKRINPNCDKRKTVGLELCPKGNNEVELATKSRIIELAPLATLATLHSLLSDRASARSGGDSTIYPLRYICQV